VHSPNHLTWEQCCLGVLAACQLRRRLPYYLPFTTCLVTHWRWGDGWAGASPMPDEGGAERLMCAKLAVTVNATSPRHQRNHTMMRSWTSIRCTTQGRGPYIGQRAANHKGVSCMDSTFLVLPSVRDLVFVRRRATMRYCWMVWLDGACVSLAWRGASAPNIAPIGTPFRFFRVGPPKSLSESTQFGPITPK
jgi:hypothetical protein